MPVKSELSKSHFQRETKIEELIFIVKKEGYRYQLIDTTLTLDTKTSDEEILLASFFPGVSRDLNRQIDLFNQNMPGIGLSYLINTIVNILGGEIAVRTSYYFINIGEADKGDKIKYIDQHFSNVKDKPKQKDIFPNEFYYAAKIKKLSNKMPKFLGNMITVRIPIKYKS